MPQHIPEPSFTDLNALQGAAFYRNSVRQLHDAGLRMMGFGGFLCGLVFLSLPHPFGWLPFLLLGVWLVSYGIAVWRYGVVPHHHRFMRAFVVIIVINGAVCITELLVEPPAPGQIPRSAIGLPMQAVIWFFFPYLYTRSLKHLPPAPDAGHQQWLEQLVRAVHQGSANTARGIITFSLLLQRTTYACTGKLGDELGVFLFDGGKEISVLPKRDVTITLLPRARGQKTIAPTSFQLGNQRFTGRIPRASYETYQQWKGELPMRAV